MGTRHPIPADLQLIGRTEELEALRDRLRATAAGTGTVVLIEGEAGIGKTRLVDEALSEATARGFQAFRGAAEELEGAQPFAPVVRSLSIEGRSEDPGHAVITDLMSRAVSGQQPVPPLQIPYPLFRIQEEILDFVERSAEVAPVLFALEDLHWADLPTLLLLRSAAHRLRYSPVAVLATFRPAPHHPQLDPVVAHLTAEGTPHLKLGPLSDDEVDSLVSQIVETPKPELRKRMSAAGGNPLFVLELLAAFAEEGMLEGGARPDALGGLGLPSSLRLTILRRLSYLSRDALELLKTAAVLGSPFSVGELSLITGRSGTDLTQPLGEAMRAGVLGEAGERLAFRHDLIREAVYEDMPVAIRRALHRDAARRLAAAGTPTVRVASQMAIGAEPGDSEAIDWLAQAGRDDKTGGLISAPLLERALELSLPADPRSDELVADLLWRLASSGRPAEAEALARDALSRPLASSLEARIRHGLAHALARAGDNLGALEEIRRAASMPGLPDEKLKEYLAFASQIALVVGDAEGAKAEAEQAVAAAERCGTGSPEALETLGWLANLSGYPLKARHLAQQANAVREVAPWASLFFIGVFDLDTDQLSAGEKALQEGRQICEELGAFGVLPIFHWGLACARFLAGDWDEVVIEAETGLDVAEEYGERQAAVWGHSFLAHIALHRGLVETAEKHLEAAEQEISNFGLQLGVDWMMWARGTSQDIRGSSKQALAVLGNAWALHLMRSSFIAHRLIAPDLVQLALTSAQEDLARSVTATAEADAETAQVPSAYGSALRCRGLLEDDPEILLAAVNAYAQGERRMEWACSCEDAARLLLRHGRTGEARPLLDAALERYEHAGATYDVARAEATLRQAGFSRGRRGRRGRPKIGWESLTPTELQVARLVAEGLSNPEIAKRLFISRRTVQTHLSHIFLKLSVSSRVELAVEVSREHS